MSGKIWRKLGLVALSSGMIFGGLGCINVNRIVGFAVDHGIYDTFLSGILGGLGGLIPGA